MNLRAYKQSPWNLDLGDFCWRKANTEPDKGADESTRDSFNLSLNVSFLLAPLWLAYEALAITNSILASILCFLLICLSVIAHELGHLYVLKIVNLKPRSLKFFPFGALTNLASSLPTKTRLIDELFVRLAGPCVTVAIINISAQLLDSQLLSDQAIYTIQVLQYFNGYLLLFSLLPIFPLDMFPLLIRSFGSKNKTREFLYSFSQWLALGILLLALYKREGLVIIISLPLFIVSFKEQMLQKALHLTDKLKTLDVICPRKQLLCLEHGGMLLAQLSTIVNSYQPYIPILHKETFVGVVSRDQALQLVMDGNEHYLSECLYENPLCFQHTDDFSKILESIFIEHRNFAVILDEQRFLGLITKEKLMEYIILQRFLEKTTKSSSTLDNEL